MKGQYMKQSYKRMHSTLAWNGKPIWSIQKTLCDQSKNNLSTNFSDEDLQKLAWFAHLKLPQDNTIEYQHLKQEMTSIMHFASHVRDVGNIMNPEETLESRGLSEMRSDEITEEGNQDILMKNAKLNKSGHFIVSRE